MPYMKRFPHITDDINLRFEHETNRLDYLFIRPILLVGYFFLRLVAFPIKFIIHRKPWGYEHYIIDAVLSFGIKYLATQEAVELLMRHVQIEPMLYRHILTGQLSEETERRELQGINGVFNIDSLKQIVHNNMTIGHDELSYELVDSFEKEVFLEQLNNIRQSKPYDISNFTMKALEVNKKHSLGIIGATNVVMTIVYTITLFADLRTTMQALNSFGSDSVLLWAMKHLYRYDPDVLTDLDFYMQVYSNRSHYSNSAFFSDPSQYLFYHIVFDEFCYETLQTRPPSLPPQ